MRNIKTRLWYLGAAALLCQWLTSWPLVASAQHAEHMNHAAPAGAAEPADHADHADHAAASYAAPAFSDADRAAAFPDLSDMPLGEMMRSDPLNKLVLLDRFEWQDASGGTPLQWDLDAWIGRSLSKLWIRSEGARRAGDTERAELELLWGHSFARWWELLAGARQDFEPGPTRGWAALGVHGTAPYRVDLEATAYVGDGGRAALRVKSRYELLITNKLILQPLVELNWYSQSDAQRGIGAGLADAEIGLRLRYEIRREVAPYIGLAHEHRFGDSRDFARAAGHDSSDTRLVAGIRLWF